jgi:hypothetical protein
LVAGPEVTAHTAATVGSSFRAIRRAQGDPYAFKLRRFGKLRGLGTLKPFARLKMGRRTPGYRAHRRHCARGSVREIRRS